MKSCPKCGSALTTGEVVTEKDGYVFVTDGKKCPKCEKQYVNKDETLHTPEPLKLYRKLTKSARGTVLRIPTDIERNLNLKGNEQVTIEKIGKNKILIEVLNGN